MTNPTSASVRVQAQERFDRNLKLKELIIDRLSLDRTPEVVSDNQPLFGRGLELDSLDTLELVVTVNNEFGVAITDDDTAAFNSINAMMDFIESRTTV